MAYNITSENASKLGKLGNAIRWSRTNAMPSEASVQANPKNPREFEQRTLARVRLQLDKVFAQFMREKDPAKLDRLAAAQSRLSEQERVLAGRPMPGSLKPSSPRRSAPPSHAEPLPAQPIPPKDTTSGSGQ